MSKRPKLAEQLRDQFEKARATSPLGAAVPVIGEQRHLDPGPFEAATPAEVTAYTVYYLAVLEDIAIGLAEEVDDLRKRLDRVSE